MILSGCEIKKKQANHYAQVAAYLAVAEFFLNRGETEDGWVLLRPIIFRKSMRMTSAIRSQGNVYRYLEIINDNFMTTLNQTGTIKTIAVIH